MKRVNYSGMKKVISENNGPSKADKNNLAGYKAMEPLAEKAIEAAIKKKH